MSQKKKKRSSTRTPPKEKRKAPKPGLSTDRNARAFLELLRKSNIPFELTCSNYTTKIESEFISKKFVYSLQTNQCFAAYAKVKKDVKTKEVPFIDKSSLVYFEHDFKESCNIGEVWNIDLKSAYATILHLDGYITKETYSYLCSLPKHDRLASVGMLASKKKMFRFDSKGTIKTMEQSISILENFFYYAVEKTFAIMQELKSILRASYLFTWVDGIYFAPDLSGLIECENYLRDIGFRYSEEILTDWKVRVVKGAVKLDFVKEGKIKSFSLPARESEFVLIMGEAMRLLSPEPKKLILNEKSQKRLAS